MPRVLNHYHYKNGYPPGAVYIGRPSKWGNPFNGPGMLDLYREWIVRQRHLLADLHELRGRDLVCFCAPRPCHGDVLLELANKEQDR